jgi:hypothetical protein
VTYYEIFIREAEGAGINVPNWLKDDIASDVDRIRTLPSVLDIILKSNDLLEDRYFMRKTIEEFVSVVMTQYDPKYGL